MNIQETTRKVFGIGLKTLSKILFFIGLALFFFMFPALLLKGSIELIWIILFFVYVFLAMAFNMYLSYLTLFKKEFLFSLQDRFIFWITGIIKGEKAAKAGQTRYAAFTLSPVFGWFNFVINIFVIVMVLGFWVMFIIESMVR